MCYIIERASINSALFTLVDIVACRLVCLIFICIVIYFSLLLINKFNRNACFIQPLKFYWLLKSLCVE